MDSGDWTRDRIDLLRRRLRRAVLRRRRLLSGLLAGAAVLVGLSAVAPPPAATETVLVAARDLPSGTVVGAGDLATVELPLGSAPDGSLSRRDATGRTLAAPVRRGEPLTDVRLVGPGLAGDEHGLSAVPVRVPDAGVVALLQVGDVVDVVATTTQSQGGVVVARRARVAALPIEGDAGPTHGPGGTTGRLVVLQVDVDVATELVAASVREHISLTFSR